MTNSVQSNLRKALELLKSAGRIQGDLWDNEGRRCLIGAIYAGHYGEQTVESISPEDWDIPEIHAARDALELCYHELYEKTGAMLWEDPQAKLFTFNDHPDTTDEQVFNVLECAIDYAGGVDA